MTATRRLAAILAADVAGYSRLIGADEEGTLDRLRAIRTEIVDPLNTRYRGRIVKTTGDGLLVEFTSVVDALRCASEWQRSVAERNTAEPREVRIEFRIGFHQGDIVVEDDDIFGDGVKRRGSARRFGRSRRDLRFGPCSRGRSRASRPHLR
jgi:adenylate cyclase